jgi:hypothetical protein
MSPAGGGGQFGASHFSFNNMEIPGCASVYCVHRRRGRQVDNRFHVCLIREDPGGPQTGEFS